MSNGIVKYPFAQGSGDPYSGFKDELGAIEEKRQAKQAQAFEMASMIDMADSSTMFGSDYSVASQWAEHLTDEMDTMAATTDGMIEFVQQAKMLSNFIDASESYKAENFGSAEGGAQAGTWSGFIQRKATGQNPYGDFADSRSIQDYETAYMSLNQGAEVTWGPDGMPMIMSNGTPMSLAEYRRPESPFMPSLQESMFGEDGYNYYDSRSESMKRVHETREGAEGWARQQIDQKKARGIMSQYLKMNPSNMTLDEAMMPKNQELLNSVIENWVSGVGDAWDDRFAAGAVDRGSEIFTGGVTNEGVTGKIEGQQDTSGVRDAAYANTSDVGSTSELLGVLGQHTGQVAIENTGFNFLQNLTTPITDDFTTSLSEGEQLTALNVDQLGNIHIEVETLVPSLDEDGNPIFNESSEYVGDRVDRSIRVISASSDADLHESLKSYLTPQLYAEMMDNSDTNATRARRSRINSRFEQAKRVNSAVGDARGSVDPSPDRDYVRMTQEDRDRQIEQDARNSDFYRNRLDELGYEEGLGVSQGAVGSAFSSILDSVFGFSGYQSAQGRNEDIRQQALGEAVARIKEQNNIVDGPDVPEGTSLEQPPEDVTPEGGVAKSTLISRLSEEQKSAYEDKKNSGGIAVLTNNPGNLRPYEGYEGEVYYIDGDKEKAFRVFDTPEEGLEALKKDLRIKIAGQGVIGSKMNKGLLPSGAKTPEEITLFDVISVYAPDKENNPEKYSELISEFASGLGYQGINPDTPVNEIPIDLLMECLLKVESNKNHELLSKSGLLPLSGPLAQN